MSAIQSDCIGPNEGEAASSVKSMHIKAAMKTRPDQLHVLRLPGDFGGAPPPDPISNSAVKPDSANGTNAQALEE
jgi:hypothetical protein